MTFLVQAAECAKCGHTRPCRHITGYGPLCKHCRLTTLGHLLTGTHA